MKLKNLNGALRRMTGAPMVKMATPIGPVTFTVQKTALIEALKQVCPDPAAETHMYLDDEGFIRLEADGIPLAQEVKAHYAHAESEDMGAMDHANNDPISPSADDGDLLIDDEPEASDDDLEGLLG